MKAAVTGPVRPAEGPLSGRVGVPGDKSISHRMALLAAVADGTSRITGFSRAGDCEATLGIVESLGAAVERSSGVLTISGSGWQGIRSPERELDCVRSGTTMRVACGLLAGTRTNVTLTGDEQLLRRPMERVAEPLRRMGAEIETTDGRPPIRIRGSALRGIEFELPVASAQVKSAVLMAGMQASGMTTVTERVPTRDHTERLLSWLKVPIRVEDGDSRSVIIERAEVPPFDAVVPGDPSSAAPLLAAAALIPGSEVSVEDVGLNQTRIAFVEVLARMGCEIEIEPGDEDGPEPRGTITARHSGLRGLEIEERDIPSLIDELPLVGVLGALAEGTTVVRGASELRLKESDRIAGLVAGLRELGADAGELPDGFTVTGPSKLKAANVDSLGDHRLAMAFAVAALAASGSVSVEGLDSVRDSFPQFLPTLESLR